MDDPGRLRMKTDLIRFFTFRIKELEELKAIAVGSKQIRVTNKTLELNRMILELLND